MGDWPHGYIKVSHNYFMAQIVQTEKEAVTLIANFDSNLFDLKFVLQCLMLSDWWDTILKF